MTLKELIVVYLGVITAIRDHEEQGEPVPPVLLKQKKFLGMQLDHISDMLEKRQQK